MEISKEFWKNRKVLVTGAGGFVGSRLVLELLNLGAKVTGVVSKKNSARPVKNNKNLKITVCDLSNAKAVQSLFAKANIDTVFHLASSSIVSRAAVYPHLTIQNNVLATLNVLEASRVNGVVRVLLASSDKAYGDHALDVQEPLPYKESHALRGLDIYSASKVCADTLAHAYAYQYKMFVAVLRCCNIYGPGDMNFTRLIPRTIMLSLSERPPVIKSGHENVLREYLYIDDAVQAYIFLAQKLEQYYGQNFQHMPNKGKETYGWLAFNVGSYSREQTKKILACPNIKTVKQIIALVASQTQFIKPVVVNKPPKFIEIPNEYLDSSKIKALGFKTKVELQQGMTASVAWYKSNYKNLKKQFLSQL